MGLFGRLLADEELRPPEPLTPPGARQPSAGSPPPSTPESHRPPAPPRGSGGQARAPHRRRERSSRPYRGSSTRAVRAGPTPVDLDWSATLRTAAPAQHRRCGTLAFTVRPDELLRRLRKLRPRRLLLLAVDISGSMGGGLMALARRTGVGLLDQAYLDRDQVALLAFRHRTAELLLPPTRHPEQVQRALVNLRCGSTTPLAAGLTLAHRTLEAATRRGPAAAPALLLISDGHANVGERPGLAALERELTGAAAALSRFPDLQCHLLDPTPAGKDNRPARRLARWLSAEHHQLRLLEAAGEDPAAVLIRALRKS